MNRATRTLAVAAAVGALLLLIDANGWLAAIAAVVAGAAALRAYLGDRAVDEKNWSSVAGTEAAVVHHPSRPQAVVRSLGWVETRELSLDPWFAVGVGFCVAMIPFASSYDGEAWWEIASDLPFLAHPVVGMSLLAAHRTATRARRDDAEEIFEVCPAWGLRRVGGLAAAVAPATALTVFSLAYLTTVLLSTPVAEADIPTALPSVLTALVLATGGVFLGRTLARWFTFSLAPVVALVVVGFVSLELGEGAPGSYESTMLLSTFGTSLPDGAPRLAGGSVALHLAWLTLITTVTGVVAAVGPLWPARPARAAAATELFGLPELTP